MTEAIKIKNLKKHYGSHLVLKGLNFCVQQGEIFALLGVNGAGKTTCMECLEGLRKPDSGDYHQRKNGNSITIVFLVCASQAFRGCQIVCQME